MVESFNIALGVPEPETRVQFHQFGARSNFQKSRSLISIKTLGKFYKNCLFFMLYTELVKLYHGNNKKLNILLKTAEHAKINSRWKNIQNGSNQ